MKKKKATPAPTEDQEFQTSKLIREDIFQIPMMDAEALPLIFQKMDASLDKQISLLCRNVPSVREAFCEIIEKIASGSTLGKNYYDKIDGEDGKAKAKKTTVLQNSEKRLLMKAFWLLRDPNPDVFAKLVVKISFLRGVLEDEIENFLAITSDYIEHREGLKRAKETYSFNYIEHENALTKLHETLGSEDAESLDKTIRLIESEWDEYVDLRSQVVKPFLRKVYSEAKKYSADEMQTLDNFQAGVFGLMRAIKNYTPTRFAHFSLVAESWIRQSILHYLRTDVNFIRLPMANWHYQQKINKAKERLEHKLSREPTMAEIAIEIELPEAKVKKILENAQLIKIFSLNAPTNNEEDQNTKASWNMESIQSDDNPEEQILKESEIEILKNIIYLFDDEEKIIFGLISGFTDILPAPELNEVDILREKIRQKAAAHNLEVNFK